MMGHELASHPLLGIVADDLAGAADTAAQFASPARPAVILVGPQPASVPPDTQRAAAVAIDADCRHDKPAECARRVGSAFAQVSETGARLPYLKLDSTLRGNVGASLRAAVEAVAAQAAVLAPAFPERGRTVAGGVLLVDGAPVAETEIASDGAAPVTVSEVSAIVRRQWNCRCAVLSPPQCAGAAELADDVAAVLDGGVELVVMDASSPDDLRTIAGAVARIGRHVLPAGSAGLARAFADTAGVRRLTPPPPRAGSDGPSSVLVLIGSRTAAAAAQIEAVRLEGIVCLTADSQEAALRASSILSTGRAVAITPGAAGHESVARVGAQSLAHLDRKPGLVLSGGATARCLCDQAGITAFRVGGELQPGVAAGHALLTAGEAVAAVVKGGAAGDAAAVVEAVRWIRGESIQEEQSQ